MVLAWILQSLFPALLPPAATNNNGNAGRGDNNDDNEYYAIMGLPKYSPPEKVRMAYKKLSLQLHPDKQQQRGSSMEAAAAATRYEKVQEAHNVLKDETKRRLYHEMRCNVPRYQFIEQGHLFHPGLVHDNLLQASWADKTRLLLFALFILVGILLQPILIAVKLNRLDDHHDDDDDDGSTAKIGSWMAILTPLWIILLSHWLFQCFVLIMVETSLCTIVAVLENTVWIIATMLFAYRLDDEKVDDEHSKQNWNKVAAAVFTGIFLRLCHHVATLREIRTAQNKMVTVEYLHQVVQPAMAAQKQQQQAAAAAADGEAAAAANDNDNDEENEDEDSAKYIIVQPDDATVLTALGLLERPPDREELESLRVQTSVEYREADATADAVRRTLVTWIIVYVPWAILVTLQLTNVIDTSWWIIFIPLWIRIAVRIAGNVFLCCCLVPPGTFPTAADDDDNNTKKGVTATDNDVASPPDEPPTARYFSHPEAEMSAFGDWGSEHLTSERINQVRRDEMGIDMSSAEPKQMAKNELEGDIEQQQQGAGGTEQQEPVAPDASAKPEETASSSGTTAATATANGSSSVERRNNADHEKTGGADEPDEEYGPSSSSDDLERLEEEYMQAKVQSCVLSCTTCLELIVLCTIVGWLQTPGAYNAFWILFPIFFIAAIILAVVACCIYARELPDIDVGSGGMTKNNGGENEHDESAAAVATNDNKGDDEENQQQQQKPPPAEPIQSGAAVGPSDGAQLQQSGAAPATVAADVVVAEKGVVLAVRPENDSNHQETGDDQKDPTNSYSEMDDLD